jgi:hypothetical protein
VSLDALVTRVEEHLDKLETKPTSPQALRELLTRLDDKIREAQDKGYGVSEIVDIIVGCDVAGCDPEALRKTLYGTLQGRYSAPAGKRAKPRTKKTVAKTAK